MENRNNSSLKLQIVEDKTSSKENLKRLSLNLNSTINTNYITPKNPNKLELINLSSRKSLCNSKSNSSNQMQHIQIDNKMSISKWQNKQNKASRNGKFNNSSRLHIPIQSNDQKFSFNGETKSELKDIKVKKSNLVNSKKINSIPIPFMTSNKSNKSKKIKYTNFDEKENFKQKLQLKQPGKKRAFTQSRDGKCTGTIISNDLTKEDYYDCFTKNYAKHIRKGSENSVKKGKGLFDNNRKLNDTGSKEFLSCLEIFNKKRKTFTFQDTRNMGGSLSKTMKNRQFEVQKTFQSFDSPNRKSRQETLVLNTKTSLHGFYNALNKISNERQRSINIRKNKQNYNKSNQKLTIVDLTSKEDDRKFTAEEVFKKFIHVLTQQEQNELKLLKNEILYFLGNISNRKITRVNSSKEIINDRTRIPKTIKIDLTRQVDSGKSNVENNHLLDFNSSMNISIESLESNEEIKKDSNLISNGQFEFKLGDHINYRYEMIAQIGHGAFGQAFKCYDHKNKNHVCIKIIKNEKKVSSQAKIEIRILKYILKHDKENASNTIKLLDHFTFRSHVCMVFELLDVNLYELIRDQEFIGLKIDAVRKIAIQILHNLLFLQKYRIIHCDLKPENILLKSSGKTGIKVIDFGSSCFENERIYSYIQSRFYRAPEIILGCEYGIEIDMWSFGCIICELHTGIPIFPGENESDQIGYMMEYLGVPNKEILLKAKRSQIFFDPDGNPFEITNTDGESRIPNSKSIEDFIGTEDELFIDLIKKCLEWNPNKRIKPDQAILHDWITKEMPHEVKNYHRENLNRRLKLIEKVNQLILNKKLK